MSTALPLYRLRITARRLAPWRIRAFVADASGASAVEFALVTPMFLLLILFIMVVALILYLNQALDYATSKAARSVMVGDAQGRALSQSDFRTKVVCASLPAAFNCNNVIVNLQTVTPAAQPAGYYSYTVDNNANGLIIPVLSNGAAQYTLGTQGSYEYLQIIYPVTFLPAGLASILSHGATFNGSPAYLLVSTAAFRNEQYQ